MTAATPVTDQIKTEGGWPLGPAYSPKQAFYLARLSRAEELRLVLVKQAKAAERDAKLLLCQRAVYAFYTDCLELGVGAEAQEVLKRIKQDHDHQTAEQDRLG